MTAEKTIALKAADPKAGMTFGELKEFEHDLDQAGCVESALVRARVNVRGGIKELSAVVVRFGTPTDRALS